MNFATDPQDDCALVEAEAVGTARPLCEPITYYSVLAIIKAA